VSERERESLRVINEGEANGVQGVKRERESVIGSEKRGEGTGNPRGCGDKWREREREWESE
jgi:hypothetical protein